MVTDLGGKTALITGAGRGIGRAVALGLADAGAALILIARSTGQLAQAQAILLGRGAAAGRIRVIPADLGDEQHRGRAAAAAVAAGRVDILVNNAATVEPLGPTAAVPVAELRRAFELNVIAPAALSAAVLPGMLDAGWGRIVNVSSAIVARPDFMVRFNAYAATKAALEAHTVNLAAELRGTGVTVNAYRPGGVDTAMQAWIRQQDPERIGTAAYERFNQNFTEGTLITPRQSAAVLIAHLAGGDTGAIWMPAPSPSGHEPHSRAVRRAGRRPAECALPADHYQARRGKETALHHDLAGKVALVTGGSRGIGAAVARALAGAGADVAITYLNSRQAAENVAAEMRATGARTRSIRADQADPAAAAAVVRQVAEELGRLDIVVNNAAVAVLGPIDGPDPGDAALDRQIRVNYTSIVAAIRAAAHVLPDGGRIINIGSGIATRTGASGVADHAGTKAALAGFTRGAARDLAPRGITVNLLQTGLVATQLTTAAGSAAQRLIASVPLGRMGRPEEIAAGVLFLASPDASYITGATLDIDGGYGA